MDAIEVLKNRYSWRKFTEEPLKQEDLQIILDCALNAPNGANKQEEKIIVLQNEETIRKLGMINGEVVGRKGDQFFGAKTVCLVVGPKKPNFKEDAYQLNTIKNGALILGAMQTAAFALGIGSCFINRCKEMLETPEGKKILEDLNLTDFEGVGCCILGYPVGKGKAKKIKENRVIYYAS